MSSEQDRLPNANLPVVHRQINGVRYSVTRMGWWAVQDAIALLEQVLGPSVSKAIQGVTDGADGAPKVEWSALLAEIPSAIARASSRGGPGRALQTLLGESTMVEPEGRKVFLESAVMDTWFSQRPADVVPWILFSLEVQVWSFFEPVAALLGTRIVSAPRARGSEAAAPTSPNT